MIRTKQVKPYPAPGKICNDPECWSNNKQIIDRLLAMEILSEVEKKGSICQKAGQSGCPGDCGNTIQHIESRIREYKKELERVDQSLKICPLNLENTIRKENLIFDINSLEITLEEIS